MTYASATLRSSQAGAGTGASMGSAARSSRATTSRGSDAIQLLVHEDDADLGVRDSRGESSPPRSEASAVRATANPASAKPAAASGRKGRARSWRCTSSWRRMACGVSSAAPQASARTSRVWASSRSSIDRSAAELSGSRRAAAADRSRGDQKSPLQPRRLAERRRNDEASGVRSERRPEQRQRRVRATPVRRRRRKVRAFQPRAAMRRSSSPGGTSRGPPPRAKRILRVAEVDAMRRRNAQASIPSSGGDARGPQIPEAGRSQSQRDRVRLSGQRQQARPVGVTQPRSCFTSAAGRGQLRQHGQRAQRQRGRRHGVRRGGPAAGAPC